MIMICGNEGKITGTPKEITLEFTHLILLFKTTLMKDFDLSETAVYDIIKKCGEIAFMSSVERQKLLDELIEDK